MKPLIKTEEPAKLIVNRRAIAAGLAALMGVPAVAAAKLSELSNVRLSFDPSDFTGQMSDGLFLPDYRKPMVRLVFSNGAVTGWHRYDCIHRGPSHSSPPENRNTHSVAIETCAPNKNGNPRYTSLAIG